MEAGYLQQISNRFAPLHGERPTNIILHSIYFQKRAICDPLIGHKFVQMSVATHVQMQIYVDILVYKIYIHALIDYTNK